LAVKKELPPGVTVGTAADQSRFIESAIGEVMENAVLGGLLAMVVLFLFLKDLRSTLIIGLTIPISIVATFFFMYRMGVSLNVMSLGGLALGVGMLVDNAVVVLEAIFRRREQGESALEAASNGAAEVGSALVGVTLTTVAVFLPVVFVEGFAAQLFKDQALTVSISILVSLVVALTLIPMVAARGRRAAPAVEAAPAPTGPPSRFRRVLRAAFAGTPRFVLRLARRAFGLAGRLLARAVAPVSRVFDRLLGWVLESYPGLVGQALDRPRLVLGTAGGLLALAVVGALFLDVDLIPAMSQGEFSVQVELPEGTPLSVTDRTLHAAADGLRADASIETFSSVAGGAGLSLTSTGTEGENFGQIDVRMKAGAGAEQEAAVMSRLRQALEQVPQARLEFQRPSLFSFRTPVEVEVFADDLVTLSTAAGGLEQRMKGIHGLVDVRSSAEMGNPELQIRFDRDALARLGLRLDAVAATVRAKVRGEVATRFNEGDREIDVVVRSARGEQVGVDEVSRVIVETRDGTPVYLSSVARIAREMGPSEIRRIGQKRAAVVSANLEAVSLGEAAEAVRGVLRTQDPVPGVVARLSGQEEERSRSFGSLLLALGLSLFLVYLVMAAEFESLVHPFVIFFTVPLGAVGVVAALLLTGQTVNVVVMIGIVMLGGIVVDNAIVLIECVKQLREEGMPVREALVQGGARRLRPILMTTATTALGLLPMAFGLGEGAELRQPLAITVIGGLLLSTLLTLVVIPVMYGLVERVHLVHVDTEAPEGTGAVPAAAPLGQ
jgi:HAE1 family hydrophobic/amphiphilic exporter-1